MIPRSLRSALEKTIDSPIVNVKPVGGGSINETAQIETPNGNYFVKWNSASRFPGMFEAEEKGLELLARCSGFVIPNVVFSGMQDDLSYILMTHLVQGPVDWKNSGRLLAKMHTASADKFGLDHNNYIGSLAQSNQLHDNWSAFFTNERILPLVKLAMDDRKLTKNDLIAAENFCGQIGDIFPDEKPALLHGDLWSGNFMFTDKGPSIFDPAVYYGHREMDIAMTKLFGGFDKEFYDDYMQEHPLEKNWEKRIDYCNLYPLLVHVNLFGGGYANDVRRILRHFM